MSRFIPKSLPLWQLMLPLLLLSNVAYLKHTLLTWAMTLGFFLFVPGYLFLRYLKFPPKLDWALFSLSVGISLSLLTFMGLALNGLHGIGFGKPLETVPIFITLDSVLLLLIGLNWRLKIKLNVWKPALTVEEWIFGALFTVLPILAIAGAMRLNNGASNILTMCCMGLIGLLFILLALRPTHTRIYPYALFMTAVTILFCNSLRGWYVTGHDIHHEFSVFNIAMTNGFWNPRTNFGDPYNACLSITILPTLLAKITAIAPIYIFKVVFQIAFAALIPALFVFARKFASEKKAFIGIFAFLTFPTFTNDLPFLNRQEIAFGYFILLLLVNFMNITRRLKTSLTAMLLLSIVLAHYSTSYASIGILLVAMLFYKLLLRYSKTPDKSYMIPLMRLPLLLVALLTNFVWNAQITASSSNLTNTLSETVKSIFTNDTESSNFGHYNLLSKSKPSTPEQQFHQLLAGRDIPAKYAPPVEIPITPVGRTVSKVIDVRTLNTRTHTLIAKILQLLVVIGSTVLFIRYLRVPSSPRTIYYLSLALASMAALVLFTFLPQLSIGYDVTRLFQQSMMVLWLPVILASELLFAWMGRLKLAATAALLVFLYFNLAGFLPQLTGGFQPQLALNNSGLYYDYFYAHKSDIVGTDWMAANRIYYMNVFMDTNSATPPLKYAVGTGVRDGSSQGYYYSDFTNNHSGVYRTFSSSGFIEYTEPTLLQSKDAIYTNGESKIYFKWGYSK